MYSNYYPRISSLSSSSSTSSTFRVILKRSFHTSRNSLARFLASDPIDEICKKIFQERGHEIVALTKTPSPDALLKIIGEYDGLIVRSGTQVNQAIIDAGKKLQVVGRAGVGVDNVDLAAATRAGIIVMNTPGGNTTSAAELSVSLIMALARSIPLAVASLKSGKWERSKFMGAELSGKSVGVIGLGRIGQEVARFCKGLGMIPIGYDPVVSAEAALKAGIIPVSLEELYAKSDIITLHVPKTKETSNLINKVTLSKCKKGVLIVNVARGGVINEVDLLEALVSGHCGGAALDVFSSEPPPPSSSLLLAHPNVICTPHLGASTAEAQINVAKDIAIQMVDAIEKKAFVGVVNASNLALLSRSDLAPFASMAESLGNLQAQVMTGKLLKVEVNCQGPVVSEASVSTILKTSVLKGLLSHTHGASSVNYINAVLLGEKLGIELTVKTSPKSLNYTNLVTVTFTTETESRSMSGSIFINDEARLVDMDGFSIDVALRGSLIFFNNQDKPGVLNRITTVLGNAGINIANFALGRHGIGGEALGVLTVDSVVSPSVLSELHSLQNVRNVKIGNVDSTRITPRVSLPSTTTGLSGDSGKPNVRPKSANFGSGPTKKRPGWELSALSNAALGRSHRSKLGKDKLKRAIDMTRSLLDLPKDYLCGIVPASDTGAYEMAMWALLGSRPVESVHFESFGGGWHADLTKQLKIATVNEHTAAYGKLPELSKVNTVDNDVCFTWNGTTSGVMVPDANWISSERKGLTLNDATSAIFSQKVDFLKCDATTYSWQKVLGGEGAHGMLILSPRARERIETHTPKWPMPKIFRLANKGKLEEGIFAGETINTPSMICVEDYLDALTWAEKEGGVAGLSKRSNENLAVIEHFVSENSWCKFLAKEKEYRSNTSVCLELDLSKEKVQNLVKLLEKENVAYDIGSYRDAPPGLRIWCGATVDTEDVYILTQWIKWAYTAVQ